MANVFKDRQGVSEGCVAFGMSIDYYDKYSCIQYLFGKGLFFSIQ